MILELKQRAINGEKLECSEMMDGEKCEGTLKMEEDELEILRGEKRVFLAMEFALWEKERELATDFFFPTPCLLNHLALYRVKKERVMENKKQGLR